MKRKLWLKRRILKLRSKLHRKYLKELICNMLQLTCTLKFAHSCHNIDALISTRRNKVDDFSVETPRLHTDSLFHGILHFLVTGETLTF